MRFFAVTPLQLDITLASSKNMHEFHPIDKLRNEILLDPYRPQAVDNDLRSISHQV